VLSWVPPGLGRPEAGCAVADRAAATGLARICGLDLWAEGNWAVGVRRARWRRLSGDDMHRVKRAPGLCTIDDGGELI